MVVEQSDLFGVVLSVLSSSCIHHWFTTRYDYSKVFGTRYTLFLVEYITLSLPPLLVHTYFGYEVIWAAACLLLFCVFLFCLTKNLQSLRTSIFREFKITILISTCIVIAAIDCGAIFTHQFGKTVTYGYSPMDLGTGLFVSVRALDSLRRDLRRINAVSGQQLLPTNNRDSQNLLPLNGGQKSENVEEKTRIRQKKRQCKGFDYSRFLPLFICGLVRLGFVKWSGYEQDIEEYGAHWNFFITLAFIEFFISLFHCIFRNDLAVPVVSVIVGLLYFSVLLTTHFEDYLLGMDKERNGLLDGNREGICSTFGYLFLFGLNYLIARFFVPPILWDDTCTQHAEHPKVLFILIRNFIIQVLVYSLGLQLFGEPSRRIANLMYGLHIHTIFTLLVLFMHVYMHRVGTRASTASLTSQLPTLHTAISRHGFYFFIAANLLTGFLNFVRGYIQTAELEFLSLLAYMFVLCFSTKMLDVLGVKII